MIKKVFFRYGWGVAASAMGTLVESLLWPYMEPYTFYIYLPAVCFVTYVAGSGPGILSAILSVLAADYFFIPPTHRISLSGNGLAQNLIFLCVSLFGIAIVESLRRTRNHLTEHIKLHALTKRDLEASEERRKIALENAVMGTWEIDPQARTVTWDDRAQALHGLVPGTFDGKLDSAIAIMHPDDVARTKALASGDIEVGKAFHFQYRSLWPDGSVRWLECKGRSLLGSDNRPSKIVGTVSDVTDKMLAEDKLKQNEARLKQALDHAALGTWILDLENGTAAWDERCQSIHGFAKDEFDGCVKTIKKNLHPADVVRSKDALLRALRTGDEFDIEYRVLVEGAAIRWIHSMGRATQVGSAKKVIVGTCKDITHRVEERERHRLNEERLDLALAQARMGAWDWNVISGEVQWTLITEQIYGLAAEKYPSEQNDLMERIHPEDLSYLRRVIHSALQTGSTFDVSHRILLPEGGVRWAQSVGRAFLDSEANPVRVVGTVRDITAQREADEKIRQSEARLKLALQNAQMGIWDYDIAKKSIRWDAHCESLIGYPREGLPSSPRVVAQFLHPDDIAHTEERITEALCSGTELSVDFRVIWRDGSVHWLEAKGKVSLNDQGAPSRFVGTLADISQRKFSGDRLKSSEERLKLALAHSQMGIWEWNMITRSLVWDEACFKIYGQPSDRAITGPDALLITHPEDREEQKEKTYEAIRSHQEFELDYRVVHQDNTIHWVHVCGRAVYDKNGAPIKMIGTMKEVTKEKNKEETVRLNEERLKLALEQVSMGTWEWNIKKGQNIWDETCYQIFDVDRDSFDFSPNSMRGLVHPDDIERITGTIIEAAKTRALVDDEIRIISSKTGKTKWVRVVARALYDEHDHPHRVIGTAVDTTNMRRERDSLYESRERLSLALKNASMGTWDTDLATLQVIWDDNAAAIFGTKKTSSHYSEIRRFIDSEDLERAVAGSHEAIEFGKEFNEVLRIIDVHGKTRWIHGVGRAIYDAFGLPVRMLGTIRDITEEQKIKEKIRKGEERLKLALGLAKMGTWEFNPRTGLVDWDDNCLAIMGLTPEEFDNRFETFTKMVHTEDAEWRDKKFEDAIANKKEYNCEYRIIWRDGTVHWIASRGRALYDEQGHPTRVLGTVIETTERRESTEQLRRTVERLKLHEDQLQEAVSARDEFISIASHELKTPLTSLKLQVQTLLKYATADSDKLNSAVMCKLDNVDKQVSRVSRLIDNLLDVARIKNKKFELDPELFDLSTLVRYIVARFIDDAKAVGSELAISKSDPILGFWDKIRIEQLIANLLSNAIKYGGGKPIDVTVENRTQSAVIVIRDRGIGISAEDRDKIFNRFERVVGSDFAGGLGLGLYITKQIVDAHHGKIEVQSEPNAGSCFIVELPTHCATVAEAVDKGVVS